MKVVLAMVLSNFNLEPAGNAGDLRWEMVVIASPTLKNSVDGKRQLPVKLSLLSAKKD